MNKANFVMVASVAVKAVKVTAIVMVIGLTVLGGYRATNVELRNEVIDHAQRQNTVAGLE